MSTVQILAIVGMPGAGKSFAATFFKDKGFSVLRFGDQTDIGLAEQGLPLTEENERSYREKIRKELGMAAMAIKIEPRLEEADKTKGVIVLDGLYSWEEYVYLKDKYKNLQLVHIYAQPSIRYARLAQRTVRPLNEKEARSRDWAEIEELHKGGPIAIADFLIENNGSSEEFTQKIQTFLNHLI